MISLFPTLRSRLILLGVLTLVPACLVIWHLAADYYCSVHSSVYRHLDTTALMMLALQEDRVSGSKQLLGELAGREEMRQQGSDACRILARALRENVATYVDIGLVDADGGLICSGRSGVGGDGLIERPLLVESMKSAGFAIAAYRNDPRTGKAIAIGMLPMASRAGKRSVLYAAIDMSWMARSGVVGTLPAEASVLLLDKNGTVLLREPAMQRWIGNRFPDSLFLQKINAGKPSGTLDIPGSGGVRRLCVFHALHTLGGNGYLAIGIPADAAFAELHTQIQRIAFALVVAAFATFAIIWSMGGRLITERLDQLGEAMRRFGQGQHGSRSRLPYEQDEIGDLARTFDSMADLIRLRETQLQQYFLALDLHAIVSMADLSGNITMANDKFCRISGYSRDELIGRNHRLLNSGYHPGSFFEEMWDTISQGKIWQGTIRNRNKEGGYYWVISTIVPQLDESGLPVSYLSIRTDITSSLRVEQALQKSEERFRLLAENSRDVVSLHDTDGRFIYVSPSVKSVLGYAPEEMFGKEIGGWIHDKDLQAVCVVWLRAIAEKGHESAVFRMRRATNDYIWVESTIAALSGQDDRVSRIQCSLRDITRRKQAEEKLRLHDKAIQASLSGLVLISAGGGYPILYVNPAFETLSQWRSEEIVGRNALVLLEQVAESTGVDDVRAAIRDKSNRQILLCFTRRDGERRWLDCAIAPVADDDNGASHYVAAFYDVTERMQMMQVLIDAKDASEQASRAKSEFLSRMTHELRTPLNFILGFAQLLEAQPEALNEIQLDGVKRIINAGWHLRRLIDEVLDLAKIEAGKLEVEIGDVELDSLLRECMGYVDLQAAERGVIVRLTESAATSQVVRADRTRLKQVLLNLLSNAVKFNHAGGSVAIVADSESAGYVRLTVSDTGIGIDSHRLDELFQPFSRLDAEKAGVPGTGIGLAISRRFIQLMGGRIGVSSELHKGSVFWIELPMAMQPSAMTT